jgi:aurora kinase
MESTPNQSLFNDVKNRFLSLPISAVEGLEHEPRKSDFDYIKELGEGSYGQVHLVSHKKTKAMYALKIIDKLAKENLEVKENFNREIEIMYKLDHPNIVKLYGHFEDDRYCYFLMQYIPKKSLYDIIPEIIEKKNLKLVASIMKDVLKAVYYLHKMRPIIIHRDIKSDNILLDGRNNAYLTDFGWSNYIEGFRKRTTACGTPVYLPPEIVKETGHDETADIWSIGVLLFLLTTGQYPFWGNNLAELEMKIKNLNINWPKNMDPDAKDLITKILKLNPKERPTIHQILNHKFITTYYPNVVDELIKPDHQERRTFVVSKDNPKTWGTAKQKIVKFHNTIKDNNNNNDRRKRTNKKNYSIHISKRNNNNFIINLNNMLNEKRNNSNSIDVKNFQLNNSVDKNLHNNNNTANKNTKANNTNNIQLYSERNREHNNSIHQKVQRTNTNHHTYYVSNKKK